MSEDVGSKALNLALQFITVLYHDSETCSGPSGFNLLKENQRSEQNRRHANKNPLTLSANSFLNRAASGVELVLLVCF